LKNEPEKEEKQGEPAVSPLLTPVTADTAKPSQALWEMTLIYQ